jgi:hypothetical protein
VLGNTFGLRLEKFRLRFDVISKSYAGQAFLAPFFSLMSFLALGVIPKSYNT